MKERVNKYLATKIYPQKDMVLKGMGLIEDLDREVDRLTAALKEREWQPIETAPREDLFGCIIGREPTDNNIGAAYQCTYIDGDWVIVGAFSKFKNPTHWMPELLPPQPEEKE